MSDEISLLPEGLRKKEEELKKTDTKPQPPAELKFSAPSEEGEDIEVIEVDEGEINQVLANEPMLSQIAYRVSSFIDDLKTKIFQPSVPPPPPKLPPQFFTPPAAKAPTPGTTARPVPAAGSPATAAPSPAPTPATGTMAAKTRVMPSATTPRRVRVIKRVRKPLRVSFVSEDELKLLHIDIPKRRFTFITAVVFFTLLLGGGYALLQAQYSAAQDGLRLAKAQTAQIKQQIADKQATWSSFQSLEPQLKALSRLLDQHMSPTHLFDLIEKNTLPTVSYGSFALTPDNKVALSVTADSIASAAAQVVAFQNSGFVSKVDTSSYNVSYASANASLPDAVTFSLTLTLTPDAMKSTALAVSP